MLRLVLPHGVRVGNHLRSLRPPVRDGFLAVVYDHPDSMGQRFYG